MGRYASTIHAPAKRIRRLVELFPTPPHLVGMSRKNDSPGPSAAPARLTGLSERRRFRRLDQPSEVAPTALVFVQQQEMETRA